MHKNNFNFDIYERHEIINQLIKAKKYKTYLEVGTDQGDTFDKINIKSKECCDIVDNIKPEYKFKLTYHMSSDEMFDRMPIDKKYDIIFLDGMHDEKYLDRDIINSLKHLNKNGVIICHDTMPTNVLYSRKYVLSDVITNIGWTGDVYKSILKLQEQNISFYTLINAIHGMTIINYYDNPYNLKVPTNINDNDYYYIFNKDIYNTEYHPNLTMQGMFAMHAINYEQFKEIYNIK